VSYVNYRQQRDDSCDKDHTTQNKCNPTISQSLKTLLSLLLGDRRDQFNETYIGKTENPGVLIIQDVLSQNKQEEGHDVEALHSICTHVITPNYPNSGFAKRELQNDSRSPLIQVTTT
jgi:hypothetical protein